MGDITHLDLYELLDVQEKATTPEIATAFRRKALKCHPDKYPDDEEKKELFLKIKKALELLTDEKARQVYDADREQKKRHRERISQMDDKRKKFKEDLERNEQKATQTTNTTQNKSTANQLRAEVERLRREGNRLVDEELEKLHQIIEQDKQKSSFNNVTIIIKYFPNTSPYTDNELREIFQKYGNISTIINMYPKRALIEFNDNHISKFIESEKGLEGKPFASVKIQKQTNTTSTSSSSMKKQYDTVDLTKPELEDVEAMVFRKIPQQSTTA